MKTELRKPIVVCGALGVLGILLHSAFPTARQEGHTPPAPAPSVTGLGAPTAETSLVENLQSQQESSPEPTPEEPKNLSLTELWLQESTSLAATYAASFRPGVYGEEPVPEYVRPLWQAVNEREEGELLNYSKHLLDPIDEWSADMEARLRQFFEVQPETSVTHVGITCRASQCKLQLISMYANPGDMRSSALMVDRLRRQVWYRERIVDMARAGGVGIPLGMEGADIISYELLTLRRRHHDDESLKQ